jgi:hypothetical protein
VPSGGVLCRCIVPIEHAVARSYRGDRRLFFLERGKNREEEEEEEEEEEKRGKKLVRRLRLREREREEVEQSERPLLAIDMRIAVAPSLRFQSLFSHK